LKLIISVNSIKYPLTGIGRYTFELAKRISILNGVSDTLFFDGTIIVNSIPTPDYREKKYTNIISIIKRFVGNIFIIVKLFKIIRNIIAKYNLNNHNDYLFHGTNFYLPDFSGIKIVTIHDLSVITHPHYHPSERVNMLYTEIERSIYKADIIITDSIYVKSEIMNRYQIDSNRINVVHLSHGEEYRPRDERDIKTTLNKYNIKWKKYILFVGTIEPRKNINTLIEAFANQHTLIKKGYKVVLVGHKGWNNKEIFEKIAKYSEEGV
jgi:glycosyltransferase involved in cell wall biosynthesis